MQELAKSWRNGRLKAEQKHTLTTHHREIQAYKDLVVNRVQKEDVEQTVTQDKLVHPVPKEET